jgi:hypothetical protein
MPRPETLPQMLARLERDARRPYTLTGPTGRTFLSMTFEDLLRMSAAEFDPELGVELDTYFAHRRRKAAPKA